jgi:hypothetical protein
LFAGMIKLEDFLSLRKTTLLTLSKEKYASLTDSSTELNYRNIKKSPVYNLEVHFNPNEKLISVSEEIFWINNSNFSTKELYFHLYANAFKNNKTEFMLGKLLPAESKSGIKFKDFRVNDLPVIIKYANHETGNIYDSTTAMVKLDSVIYPHGYVKIKIEFEMKIPKALSRCGYSADEDFYFISQWFPKLGVFQNGSWICNKFYPFTEFYSDFSNYNVKISVPEIFLVAGTGNLLKNSKNKDGVNDYLFYGNSIHDFAFCITKNYRHETQNYISSLKDKIEIKIVHKNVDDELKQRFVKATTNSLKFFEKYIGHYPYKSLTIIDAPKNAGRIGGMEYPTLFTFNTPLFPREQTHYPEKTIIHEFCHQYFYGILANNEVTEAWLDEGISEYFTTKILNHYYPPSKNFFHFMDYYPVYGINFLQISQIPIVYTLQGVKIPEGALSLKNYYNYANFGSLSDTSYKLLNENVYSAISYSKGEIFFLTLERFIGFEKLMKIFKKYYDEYKFKHPTAQDFFRILRLNCKQDLSWFIDGFYYGASLCDYQILNFSSKDNNYSATFFREGEAKVPQTVAVYTDKDTLFLFWNGKDRIKTFTFRTINNVLGIELDPGRKNLFDIDFANNSFTTSVQYSGSVSLIMRWFFWMQNFLMIMGGLS